METGSRQTASTYINNLLLSRGLLRNGTPIGFARPEEAEGGIHATMSQVMNLVHDLILRRDRESEILSTLSQNTQALRATATQQSQTIARLEIRASDLDRQLALTAAQERSAQATLRSAETRNRALREEMARLKASVAQIRAQCATDIRRRDGDIARMKKHLEGRRGRDGTSSQVGVVIVTPGINKNGQPGRNGGLDTDLDSPEYSLKEETTEFLTQLSQGLSDENDALIGLVRGTLATLRSLQGLPANQGNGLEVNAGLEGTYNEEGVMIGPPSCEALATSTDEVLEHLRGLLTNPSFVPLEEVEVREEEIHRLREGWEMMAKRWREAVSLMAGWKKRVMDEGDTIKLEDLKVGLKLGSGIPSAHEAHHSPFKLGETGRSLTKDNSLKRMHNEMDEPLPEDSIDEDMGEFEALKHESALQEKDANVQSPKAKYTSGVPDEDTRALQAEQEDLSLLNFPTHKVPRSPLKPRSKTPLQTRAESPTVAEKLNLAKQEAENSRKRAANKATKRPSCSKHAVTKKLTGSRRRSTLSPQELERLMDAS